MADAYTNHSPDCPISTGLHQVAAAEIEHLKAVIRELDDANNAYAKFVSGDGIEAHRQNRERLIAAWNTARKAVGRAS